MSEMQFTVLGKPQPQGSGRGVPVKRKDGRMGIAVTTSNPKLHGWRQEVGWAALKALPEATIFALQGVPVRVEFMFVLSPPKKLPRGRIEPIVKPDIDKLCRAGCDAMKGIVWHDDAQVTDLAARKVYGMPARTEIRVVRQ